MSCNSNVSEQTGARPGRLLRLAMTVKTEMASPPPDLVPREDAAALSGLGSVSVPEAFEDIIDEIGGSGPFQRRLLYVVLGPLFFFLPMSVMNEVFLLTVPDHHCYHPSQDGLKNLNEWRECFLQKEVKNDGRDGYNSCEMRVPEGDSNFLDISSPLASSWSKATLCPMNDTSSSSLVSCPLGWRFDQTEFTRTAVTENEWICDQASNVPNLFTCGVIGGIIGTFVFTRLSDRYGRRMVFWYTTLLVVIAMTVKTFFSHSMWLYYGLKLVASSAYSAVFLIPFSIITEVADAKYRSWAVGVTCLTWTFGLCLLPLIAWLSADWRVISLVTAPPLALVFLGWNFVPESPRWLLTRQRVDKSYEIMMDMVRVNKVKVPDNLRQRLDQVSKAMLEEEPPQGLKGLFAYPRMIFKSLGLAMATIASNFLYYQLMLNVGHMAGNTFLNYFLLSIIEAPACYLAAIIMDKFGRRWSHSAILLFNFIFLLFNSIFANQPSLDKFVNFACIMAKFNCSATFVIMYVQAIELYPTNIRNTGIGLANIMASIFGISGPYIVHLGHYDVRIPYAIMAMISLCGSVAVSFLPETVGADLPETLEQAENFGKDHKYFSWRPISKSRRYSIKPGDVKMAAKKHNSATELEA